MYLTVDSATQEIFFISPGVVLAETAPTISPLVYGLNSVLRPRLEEIVENGVRSMLIELLEVDGL